ncbi:MAG: CIS tube protein [Pseudonocardiales bacterium]
MARNKASMAAELLGLGPGGGGLQKLRITHDGQDYKKNGPIEALFNPHEISTSRSVSWQQKKAASQGGGWTWSDMEQEFLAVAPETLSLELFFDTYESRSQASDSKRAASFVQAFGVFQTGEATDVTKLTRRVAKLAEVDKELHHPPICRLSWGAFTNIFTGVLTQLDQRFTLFLADGTPVRATLSCSFVESPTPADVRAREMNSADVVKTRVVRRHDTLHSLAAEEYRDPSLWRHIASANGIVNPRELKPGTVLTIPKLSR